MRKLRYLWLVMCVVMMALPMNAQTVKKRSQQEISLLAKRACAAFEAKRFQSAISLMDEYKQYAPLPRYGYYMLTLSCLKTGQNERCVNYGKEWEKSADRDKDERCKALILGNMGVAYSLMDRYEESIEYFRRSSVIHQQKDKEHYARDCENIGYGYWALKDYDQAREWFQCSAESWMTNLKTDLTKVEQGRCNNADLGRVLYDWSMACYAIGDDSMGKRLLFASSRCGYAEAKEYIEANGIQK